MPGCKVSLVNPRRNRTFGVPASIAQLTTMPSGCFTEMCSQQWGLTHSIFVIVPVKFTGLFASNSAAKAWCADAEDAHPDIARPVTQTAMTSFVRIDCLLACITNEDSCLARGGPTIPSRIFGTPACY